MLEQKDKYFLFGVLSAIFVVAIVFKFIPLTAFELSIIGDLVKPTLEPAGTRLFVLGVHIHHFMFGLFLLTVGYVGSVQKKLSNKVVYFLYGFGAVLVLDQAHFLLGLEEFGV